MKNQYFGDIGDYGKYGLLRFIAAHNIKLGVNWYLTLDDETNHGKAITYLDTGKERYLDPQLFDFLKAKVKLVDKNVRMLEEAHLIQNAIFYHEVLRREQRQLWHQQALKSLQEAELIFADPDNGTIGAKGVGSKDSEKYILPSEIVDYFKRGQSVVYYCHRARRTEEQWNKTKSEMKNLLPEAKLCVLTYHKGQQRSYIFVIQPKDYRRYVNVIYKFLQTSWGKVFSQEYINGINPANESVGHTLAIELDDGTVMTIDAQADGWVAIQFSDQKGITRRMRGDDLARAIRR